MRDRPGKNTDTRQAMATAGRSREKSGETKALLIRETGDIFPKDKADKGQIEMNAANDMPAPSHMILATPLWLLVLITGYIYPMPAIARNDIWKPKSSRNRRGLKMSISAAAKSNTDVKALFLSLKRMNTANDPIIPALIAELVAPVRATYDHARISEMRR